MIATTGWPFRDSLASPSKGMDMSKHRIERTARMSAAKYVTTGVGGAAMVAAGLSLAITPDKPSPSTHTVQLAAFDSLFGGSFDPSSVATTITNTGSLFGTDLPDFTPAALADASTNAVGFNVFHPIGYGGWLIGNGINASSTCTTDCRGGDAGILFGRGGEGAKGGNGGSGGLFFGTGGAGGQGITGGGTGDRRPRWQRRRGGLFFGTGGAGGQAERASQAPEMLAGGKGRNRRRRRKRRVLLRRRWPRRPRRDGRSRCDR